MLALVVLMTVGGVPSVYYGDEQGFVGVKEERLGGDDEIRPEMPPTPADLAPWGADMFRRHQDLIGLRRRHAWLVRATTEATSLTNTRYAYTARSDGQALHVELDVTDGFHAVVRDDAGTVLFEHHA